MSTKNGAFGVRIELKDQSAYSTVTATKPIAGIVGYAPKGELNVIHHITNTAALDTYLGLGFNNPRYNQGLYAARAVLDAGGYVDFVRPYGEEIDLSDPAKRDLKTDMFVVAFDRDPNNLVKSKSNNTNATKTSLMLDYYASTRYKTDGAANYGITRKINNIAEAVTSNSNVDFSIDASDYATLSSKSRGSTDMVLFGILSGDPSSAQRSYVSYDAQVVSDTASSGTGTMCYECTVDPGFSVGDVLYAPVQTGSSAATMYSYLVTNIIERKFWITANDAATKAATGYQPKVFYHHDSENAVANGDDYLSVKTASSGRGAKLFSALNINADGVAELAKLLDGMTIMNVRTADGVAHAIRIQTGNGYGVTVTVTDGVATIESVTAMYAAVGDEIKLTDGTDTAAISAMCTVTSISDDGKKVTAIVDTMSSSSSASSLAKLYITGYSTPFIQVLSTATPETVADDLVEVLMDEPFGYGSSVVSSDIETNWAGASDTELKVTRGDVFNFAAGDTVAIVARSTNLDSWEAIGNQCIAAICTVKSIDGYNSKVYLNEQIGATPLASEQYSLVNLSNTNRTVFSAVASVESVVDESTVRVAKESSVYIVGNYLYTVPVATQSSSKPVADIATGTFTLVYKDDYIIEHSEKVLLDSSLGSTFVGLGLATIRYMDVNFTGSSAKVYDLTEEGEAVARLYLSVAYKYAGQLYEFEGTIVPYVYNNTQLSIAKAAESELEGSGVKFLLNDSGELDMFLEDNSYDLSGTLSNGLPSSASTMLAFNVNDPAMVYDAVWSYSPSNNSSSSTISTAYSLFTDKDESDVAMFVAAGMCVNNFGLKAYESLNLQTMSAILNICELRKDCFAIFDGLNVSNIDKVITKYEGAARFQSTIGRWGAIYDARPVFYDANVVLDDVEAAPSIAMASLIMGNRTDGIWWRPPFGKTNGRVPGAWCDTVKNKRKFNVPEDSNSDIARLTDMHINPFRTTSDGGIYSWGDFTLQMEDTAFNAIGVAMLVAGVHKMFYHYLDDVVGSLNSPALRSTIQDNIQEQLDMITNASVPGFTSATCVCDDTNNTTDIVNQHKLIVDLYLYPTSSIRYITLRTTVTNTENGNVITTELK